MVNPKLIIFCAAVMLHFSVVCIGQSKLNDFDYWTAEFSKKGVARDPGYTELSNLLASSDTATTFDFLDEMQKRNRLATPYVRARLKVLTSYLMIQFHRVQSKSEVISLLESALNDAYETGDEQFIAFISFISGANAVGLHEMELAAMYLLKGQEFYDRFRAGRQSYDDWVILGEVLFHCREYEKSLFYTRKAIENVHDSAARVNFLVGRLNNTIGQNLEQIGKYDSALVYYKTSAAIAERENVEVWKGINAGFIGGLYFRKKDFRSAKPLLEYDYVVNKTREYQHASRSLEILAKIDLASNRPDSALIKAKEALALLFKMGERYYLQPGTYTEHVYRTTADIYRAKGNTDSFYVYNELANNLHDSLQKVILLSSTKIARMRVDNDNNFRAIQLLQREKDAANLTRNLIILSAVLASIILFLYLNRMKSRQRFKQQIALQEKNLAEMELTAAKQQMQLITANVVEKTALVERLNEQLSHRELNNEQHQLINEISNQTILTEAEWENFKTLFERIYPGFFIRLKEKARDITIAEQRMAALTRLNLTARQMASMLGISVDSVHKTRQRLRQRLQFSSEQNLEESVASL